MKELLDKLFENTVVEMDAESWERAKAEMKKAALIGKYKDLAKRSDEEQDPEKKQDMLTGMDLVAAELKKLGVPMGEGIKMGPGKFLTKEELYSPEDDPKNEAMDYNIKKLKCMKCGYEKPVSGTDPDVKQMCPHCKIMMTPMNEAQEKVDYELRGKILKIESVEYPEAMKLIYQWVKQGAVTLKQFIALCDANREAV